LLCGRDVTLYLSSDEGTLVCHYADCLKPEVEMVTHNRQLLGTLTAMDFNAGEED
jgi:hypothetical protein